MKKFDRVKWQYTHSLNSRSKVERVKFGIYYGRCRHTSKHWRHRDRVQMAWVHFDGNKRWSKVPLDDLRGFND